MRLSDYVRPELILLDIEATEKIKLLRLLVEQLQKLAIIQDPSEVLNLLLEREKVMTTGIKRGYALPHCFTRQLSDSLMMMARLKEGIDFESLDKQPVYLIFVLLGPPESERMHLKILARLARLIGIEEFFERLMKAQNAQEVTKIIAEEEKKFSFGKIKL